MRGMAAGIFTAAVILLITLRIFGILGKEDPGALAYLTLPLVISIVIFLLQAKDTLKEWYTGFSSILKLVFLSPLLWSLILTYMLIRVGTKIIEIKGSIGEEVLYGTGDLYNYTIYANILSSLIYSILLFMYSAKEKALYMVNVTGLCAFLLVITAIVNIYFYVEVTTKPVLP